MPESPLDRETFGVQFKSDQPIQVVGMGLNAVDWICVVPHFPKHDSKMEITSLHRLGGGQTATACTLCARYGLRTRYLGRVGDDEIGRFSEQSLRSEPLELCLDVVPGAVSQYAFILVDEASGERTILWKRDRRLTLQPQDLSRRKIVDAQLLHLDGHDQEAAIQAASWAREAGVKVSLDIDRVQPGVERLLALVDFVLPTQGFVERLFQTDDWHQALRQMKTLTAGFVAVTRGREGAAALWDDEIHEIQGFAVKTIDTTGAGDIFHGAFVYSLFQDWAVGKCLRFSSAAAALCCTRFGARCGIAELAEVVRLMEEGENGNGTNDRSS